MNKVNSRSCFVLALSLFTAVHIVTLIYFQQHLKFDKIQRLRHLNEYSFNGDTKYPDEAGVRGSTDAADNVYTSLKQIDASYDKAVRDVSDIIDNAITNLKKLQSSNIDKTKSAKDYSTQDAEQKDKQVASVGGAQPIHRTFTKQLCPRYPTDLKGNVIVTSATTGATFYNKTVIDRVKYGGSYEPPDCTARERVAIIVPYRDRAEHLEIFLNFMHSLLQRQQLSYTIFLVEMALPTQFNRGLLANVGFITAESTQTFSCFIIHDVDLLPVNEHNLYRCSNQIRHMSVSNSKYRYILPYEAYMGGVVAFRRHHFIAINGFSNLYFGWGAEDDDLFIRLRAAVLAFERPTKTVGTYFALRHGTDSSNPVNPIKNELLESAKDRINNDGLNSVPYNRLALEFRDMYTWVYVKVDEMEVMKNYSHVTPKPWIDRNSKPLRKEGEKYAKPNSNRRKKITKTSSNKRESILKQSAKGEREKITKAVNKKWGNIFKPVA